uniref:Retinoic acid receptor responder protein 2 n=1 Tax=Sinocyclocheilus grahami TaxID=75366 RepID=A0A672RMU7_SINGR
MAVLLWVVLLSAGVSLSQAQESFSKLPDIYKKGVELALRAINAHHASKDHFLFLKSIHQAEIEAGFDVVYIYHNFYLKGTKCKRGTENADTTSCAFRNDRPYSSLLPNNGAKTVQTSWNEAVLSACSWSSCSDWLKMPLLPLALLLAAGVLLSSAEAQSSFSKLPDSYKHGVELAEKNVNAHEGVQHHFLFFRTVQKSQIDAGFDVVYIYHNFYLKATKCKRGTENADTTTCAFRNDRPLIDCAICYKTYAGATEEEPKPYVSCVHKPALTQDMKKDRIEHCNKMGYSSGSPTLLAVIS